MVYCPLLDLKTQKTIFSKFSNFLNILACASDIRLQTEFVHLPNLEKFCFVTIILLKFFDHVLNNFEFEYIVTFSSIDFSESFSLLHNENCLGHFTYE